MKGHVTEEQVQEGKFRRKDKEGNDEADAAAEKGVELHGDCAMQLGNFYEARQQDMIGMMTKIQSFLVDIAKTATESRKPKGMKGSKFRFQETQKTAVANKIWYPPSAEGSKIETKAQAKGEHAKRSIKRNSKTGRKEEANNESRECNVEISPTITSNAACWAPNCCFGTATGHLTPYNQFSARITEFT